MSKKKLIMEHRQSERYNPEPEDAEHALFFENEITIKFPCDPVEREVTDLSCRGLKVFLEDKDPLEAFIGQNIKALLTLGKKSFSIKLKLLYKTEDDYGLSYVGGQFEGLSSKEKKLISSYLQSKKEK